MQTVGRLTENGPEAGPPRPAHTAAPLLMAWEQADLTVLGDVRLRCVPWAGPLFPSGLPTVADVQQRRHRGANSCYVLAALMAIAAQHPAYLGCMVGVCGTHSVQVTCYKNFTETLTTTHRPNRLQFTADLLSYKKLGRLHRLSTTGPALWPSFCEKAYALCHGGAHALTVPGHSVLPLQLHSSFCTANVWCSTIAFTTPTPWSACGRRSRTICRCRLPQRSGRWKS
jgi:hypothetical protein